MATQRSKQPIKGWGKPFTQQNQWHQCLFSLFLPVAVFGYICPAGLTRAAAANA